MNHQVQNLTGFGLELERFYISCHAVSLAVDRVGFKLGGLRDGSKAALILTRINIVDGVTSRYFRFLGGLPAFEISAENEKLSPDLDDPNALFLNDSAEMPHRESGEFGRIRDI